ncbi:hypothetical protein IGS59_14785 [Janthinobacterium sp. GW460P]|uniref:hypothetical protein n=1 Tax=unclassified Janthinobacterium TaxID=2610881 RepID=UPI00111C8FED|nr:MULTISPECIES: hypothetical protein [unclassified Janthinobacterium]MCC7703513.1 hypothetical protein [Janthinobacterium sp. GW460P]MCC7709020.1 hypothetical protein [Janthinobacterium sp. GW460W]
MTQNSLLSKLLTLQQDGQRSISGPTNWLKPTVLEVQTNLHAVIDALEQAVVPNTDSSRPGRWHFFVGSPGNGKSAGAGDLVRRLDKRGDTILDLASGKTLRELSGSDVPYRLDVFAAGQKFPYLYIAQDASVLPDPYDPDADPALALEELLIDAAERGVSVVVCTNRGVIERTFSRGYLDPLKNGEGWFKAIRMAVGDPVGTISLGPATRKRVFDSIEIGVTSLDQRSLVLASDTLEHIIVKAINAPEWAACEGCPSRSMCPFRANRDWLAQPELRGSIGRVLLHAELFDGQVIVLREALALISLLLAGCPHDYSSAHPCDWVHQKRSKGDIFALASRRLYMVLFSSYSPFGLAIDPEDRAVQTADLKSLTRSGSGTTDQTNKAMKFVVDGRHSTSTDVGVQRLLGMGRVLSSLDPFSDVLPPDFLDRWNESWIQLQSGDSWVSEIERACFSCWEDLQRAAAASLDSSPTVYRWLTRWITAYTIRAGALVEKVTTYGNDLDELASILGISGQPTRQQMLLIDKIEMTLALSLNPVSEGLVLSPSTSLHGDWPTQALKPKLKTGSGGAITAHLSFGGSNHTIPMSTRAFVWLKRKAEREMASATFPNEYLGTARDAMLRVAVTSAYDTKDGIELRITRANEPSIQIKRAHGGMVIDVI